MSAFGKVAYSENDEIAQESVIEEFDKSSTIDEQVEKFDNSYSVKLQELYDEYGKITIDEDKIKEVTQIKTNAVNTSVPFRVALVMSVGMIVTLLLAFLCIYNISVINNAGANIEYLQEEVNAYESELVDAQKLYNNLTSEDAIIDELVNMGFGAESSSNIVAIEVADKSPVVELEASTNWFDGVCNFIAQIFG
jgi:hypothetical protein